MDRLTDIVNMMLFSRRNYYRQISFLFLFLVNHNPDVHQTDIQSLYKIFCLNRFFQTSDQKTILIPSFLYTHLLLEINKYDFIMLFL